MIFSLNGEKYFQLSKTPLIAITVVCEAANTIKHMLGNEPFYSTTAQSMN